VAAGACGKVGWRRAKTDGIRMRKRDDLRVADGPAAAQTSRPGGGDPRRLPCPTSCSIGFSICREFVAIQSGYSGEAVTTLALARANCTTEPAGFPPDTRVRSAQLVRCQRFRSPLRQILVVRAERFSRLCVLMNPILPGSRSIWTWPAQCFLFASPVHRNSPVGGHRRCICKSASLQTCACVRSSRRLAPGR
jgi:hypothetical protein